MNMNLIYYTEKFEKYNFSLMQSINSIGMHFNNKKVGLIKEVYLSILNRIGINITSIHILSKNFLEQNVSSSIALLFRACISDMILGYYLISFTNNEKSFEGEIKVKNVEFLKYVQRVGPKEQKLLSKGSNNTKININEFIKRNFKDYLEKTDNQEEIFYKSNSDIRKECESNPTLLNNDLNLKLTEENLFKNLGEINTKAEDHFDSIYIIWRYYSQFQHFTHLGRVFMKDSKKNILYYFMGTLIETYNFLSVMQKTVFCNLIIENFDQAKMELIKVYEDYKLS
ncbi:MAG TPA: hypothetical protein PLK12_02910 [Prolixibacteraceae bacterium]|nr:hypothetical protein [Prolixibacteraceae bacterium]